MSPLECQVFAPFSFLLEGSVQCLCILHGVGDNVFADNALGDTGGRGATQPQPHTFWPWLRSENLCTYCNPDVFPTLFL